MKAPDFLTAEAKRIWETLVPQLAALDLISGMDEGNLAVYCESYARWQHCQAVIEREGLTYTSSHGSVIARPEVAIGNRALVAMQRLATEFGLTPNARGRMVLLKRPVDDDTLGGLLE
jgi:P27 family predicted phage terminase small subunit